MSDTAKFILDFVTQKGGKTTYPELYEATPYEQRGKLRNALKELKAANLVQQQMVLEPETKALSHNLLKVG